MIMPHLKYLRYVLRHKWFVFVECCKLGIPWLGIVHDLSKFRLSEWFAYAEYFYGKRQEREWFDAYGVTNGIPELAPYGFFVKDRFNFAWLHHQKRNKHHWQYWVLAEDDGPEFALPMPDRYRKEMLADWIGAGRAVGNSDTQTWYLQQCEQGRQKLHSETRGWIEKMLHLESENRGLSGCA